MTPEENIIHDSCPLDRGWGCGRLV